VAAAVLEVGEHERQFAAGEDLRGIDA
jgi:hypothetical protein